MSFPVALLTVILFLTLPIYSQSGRRMNDRLPAPPVAEKPNEANPVASAPDATPPVTAEKNQDYRCTDDGTLARILEDKAQPKSVLSSREVDSRAVITTKPKPGYTREARRIGVQGYVILRVVLSSIGKIDRLRVIRGLPGGLTENAINAACKIEFRPALKAGKPVSQWLNVEYVFRLADSSIVKP